MAPIAYGAVPAFGASSAPPWEPDPNSAAPYSSVLLYDVNGNPVTSGTNLDDPFAYAVATTPGNVGANQATINFYNPQPGLATGNWTGTSEAGDTVFSPSSSLPVGTPADLVAFAPTYPVVQAAADITTWINANIPSTQAGYANTIQIRLADSGPRGAGSGTHYWEADIGYNTSAAAITVDGTKVPAHGWAQLFPLITKSTTKLTSTLTSPQTVGTAIPLTATVTPSTAVGSVQFYDGSTALGTPVTVASGKATYTDSRPPKVGKHSYSAEFIPGPPPGDETNPNTAKAKIVGGSKGTLSFTISNPTVTSVSPTQLAVGAKGTYTINGTGFETGAKLKFQPASITSSNLTVTATKITATLTAKAAAAPGAYTVTVTNPTGGGSGSCIGCLSVIAAPTITGVSPSSVAEGSSVGVTVTGTGFAAGATLSGPKGVTYSGLTVVSATKITATMKVSGTAPKGQKLPITVTNTATAGAGKGVGDVLTIT